MKKERTKIVAISITDDIHLKAKELSKQVLGKENVSGLFTFLINNYEPKIKNV